MTAAGATVAEIEEIIGKDAPVLARIIGVPGLSIRLDKAPAGEEASISESQAIRWDPRSNEMVVTPGPLLSRGYSGEEVVYAVVVEILVTARSALATPDLGEQVEQFVGRGEAEAIFYGVFSGLAASRRAHALLPRWEAIGRRLYGERLYPEDHYLESPRHLQFLYKVARDQMVPGSRTEVAEETDVLLASFHDYLGTGRDLLDYSTRPAKSATEVMSAEEQISIWTRNIYPEWVRLLDADRAEVAVRATRRVSTGERRVARAAEKQRSDFAEYYERHRTKRQPRSLSTAEQQALRRDMTRRSRNERSEPALLLDAQLRAETGRDRHELERYAFEVERYREQADEIRTVYRELLSSHLERRRTLRGGHPHGEVLSPERLGQTLIDIRTEVTDPPAFSTYEPRAIARDHAGRADFVFVFDRSGSMMGEKSAAAASAAVMCLEAFAGMQRDVDELAARSKIDLDVDIRCAVFTYNDSVSMPKPLTGRLSLAQRLATVSQIRTPNGGNADTHVLQAILDLAPSPDRRRTLVVVSDGEADDPDLARAKVEQLRKVGWRVFGISIGSDAAVRLYAPHSRRVDDPALVPDVLSRLLKESL